MAMLASNSASSFSSSVICTAPFGAAGMLIVDDPPGYLPDVYANMEEKLLFLSGHNLNTLQTMAQSSQSVLLEDAVTVDLLHQESGLLLLLLLHLWNATEVWR